MKDPIVEEVRKYREQHAAKFNYDLDAIVRDIQKRERASKARFVDFSSEKLEAPRKRRTKRKRKSPAVPKAKAKRVRLP